MDFYLSFLPLSFLDSVVFVRKFVFEEEPACLLLIYRHIFSVSYIFVDLDIMPALLMNGASYRIGLIAVAVILTKYGYVRIA